ncbi:MAG: CDP-alcohol phosphatidyltransferase family protein [Patescibacteria group bacterium]
MNLQKYSDNFLEITLLRLIPKKITPNQVSGLRIWSLPFIFYSLLNESYVWGLAIFTIAALTDAVDGALARKRSQVTDLGKILDAVADRGLIGLVALIFVPRYFGWGLMTVIIVLELLNARGAYLSKKRTGRTPGANWAGKVKMMIQCFAFGMIFIGIFATSSSWLKSAEFLLYASLIFTFLESFLYRKKY